MSESANKQLARKMIALHVANDEGWVDACYHPDCDWIELPFAGSPGRNGDAAAMKAAAAESAKHFPQIDIVINNIMEDGDRVALHLNLGENRPLRSMTLRQIQQDPALAQA